MAFALRGRTITCLVAILLTVGCAPAQQPTTPPPADTTPPNISDIDIEDIESSTAQLEFTTDEPTLCFVQYGTTQAFGLSETSRTSTCSHQVQLDGLSPGQTYYVCIRVQDAAGNCTTSSIITFETPGPTVEPSPTSTTGELAVYIIDVGQGDAILIDYNDSELLIDGGPNADCLSCLNQHVDGPLDVMVATHMHADHIGGLPDVLERFDVQSIWINGETVKSNIYETFTSDVADEGAEVHIARRGDTIQLGDICLDVLNPTDSLSDEPNLNSVVLALSYGQVDFLFTGDAETPVEDELLDLGLVHDVDILKVGHHCSRTASGTSFLNCIKPEVAIYSAGVNNRYGHPHQEALDRLTTCGAQVYGTDVYGTIVVTTDGQTYDITFEHSGTATPPQPEGDDTPADEPTPTTKPEESDGHSDVRISKIYYDGQVPRVESDEYVEIKNYGDVTVNLDGWVLKDISDGKPTFTFPSYDLEPGEVVRVYTNETHAEYGGFSFGSETAVWANSNPDTAGLYNPNGELVSQKSY